MFNQTISMFDQTFLKKVKHDGREFTVESIDLG